jgi:hypothetical protein
MPAGQRIHQLFDQRSAAFGSGADVVDIFQLAWTGFTFEFSGRRQNDGEEIVEVMGNAARELANGLKLLRPRAGALNGAPACLFTHGLDDAKSRR